MQSKKTQENLKKKQFAWKIKCFTMNDSSFASNTKGNELAQG